MELQELDEAYPVPRVRPSTPRPRGGVGVTRVVRSMLADEDPKRYGPQAPASTPIEPARAALGFTWETILSQHLALTADATPDMEQAVLRLDGMLGVVDRLDLEAGVIEEYKLTWASSRKDIDHPFFSYWHIQAAAYCYMAEVDTCRFRVLYVNGDYTHPHVPLWRQAQITWTVRELRDNWHQLLEHGHAAGLLT